MTLRHKAGGENKCNGKKQPSSKMLLIRDDIKQFFYENASASSYALVALLFSFKFNIKCASGKEPFAKQQEKGLEVKTTQTFQDYCSANETRF